MYIWIIDSKVNKRLAFRQSEQFCRHLGWQYDTVSKGVGQRVTLGHRKEVNT